ESQSGESQSGESQSGESQSGESQSGESQSGESQSGESQSGESSGDRKQTQSGESNPSSSASEENSGDGSSSGDLSGNPRNSGSRSNSTPRGGAGEGSDVTNSGQDAGTDSSTVDPPKAANLEYTKQATDMVLDYLKETRDAPDRKLLEELQWDEQDLQRFSERWQGVRDLKPNMLDGSSNPDVEEALRSLGLRSPTDAPASNDDSADTLRGIRDSGNRKPPPAAFRDAFDAFRRSLNP
ncbi:MAG: circumsporozoite protein-membrane associated protein, partial [Planctomycetaceae bacterium]|nr:circumsporozoite protein-membrane associated protein [Planctomycetaceae bacterium]